MMLISLMIMEVDKALLQIIREGVYTHGQEFCLPLIFAKCL